MHCIFHPITKISFTKSLLPSLSLPLAGYPQKLHLILNSSQTFLLLFSTAYRFPFCHHSFFLLLFKFLSVPIWQSRKPVPNTSWAIEWVLRFSITNIVHASGFHFLLFLITLYSYPFLGIVTGTLPKTSDGKPPGDTRSIYFPIFFLGIVSDSSRTPIRKTCFMQMPLLLATTTYSHENRSRLHENLLWLMLEFRSEYSLSGTLSWLL